MRVTPPPLAGLKVLELARVLAGPWAGQLLADLGATVIKVERPGSGDETRAWGPPFVSGEGDGPETSAYFHSANRGKRSIVADFANADDLAMIRALAAQADVVVENFKVGGLAAFGLDYASLSAINPDLVYCSITGFGQDGPYARRLGYDFIVQGMSGLMDLTGRPEDEPQKVGIACADIFAGLYAATAIVAAVHQRTQSGRGTHIDLSLLDCQVVVLANQAMSYLTSNAAPRRLGNAHPTIVPYEVFATRDGHIIIAAGNDEQFRRLCRVLGTEELAGDDRFSRNADRVSNREVLIAALAETVGQRCSSELLAALERSEVPAGPINRLDEVFADPQVIHRGMRQDLARADGSTVPTVRSPILYDSVAAFAQRASPEMGEATAGVRAAFGKGDDLWRAIADGAG